jgi:hypothetical protein
MKKGLVILAVFSIALFACKKEYDSNLEEDPGFFFNPSNIMATYTGGWKSNYTGTYWSAESGSHNFAGMNSGVEWAQIIKLEDNSNMVQVQTGHLLWNCDDLNADNIFNLDLLYTGISGDCCPNEDICYEYSIQLKGPEHDSLIIQVITDSHEGDGIVYERYKHETKNYILLKE